MRTWRGAVSYGGRLGSASVSASVYQGAALAAQEPQTRNARFRITCGACGGHYTGQHQCCTKCGSHRIRSVEVGRADAVPAPGPDAVIVPPLECPKCHRSACAPDDLDATRCGSCGAPGHIEVPGADEDDRGRARFAVETGR